MRTHLWLLLAVLWFGCQSSLIACIWDGDTLADEKKARPAMVEAILGKAPNLGDPTKLRQRIAELNANRREKDPAWWNDLAGAYIRLGEPKQAVALLQTNVARFPNDYGIHANLGTAYHLLGRYKEAEKEIARDLQINPDAHFGLEKYHLALLQYLLRDADYQFRHVFVDEFARPFLSQFPPTFGPPTEGLVTTNPPKPVTESFRILSEYIGSINEKRIKIDLEQLGLLGEMAASDPFPDYRKEWNLGADTNLQAGVIYMATLNPKQPACFVMLGVLSQHNRDLNLAAAAYDKAIQLNSPQSKLLRFMSKNIKRHIREAEPHRSDTTTVVPESLR